MQPAWTCLIKKQRKDFFFIDLGHLQLIYCFCVFDSMDYDKNTIRPLWFNTSE